MFSPVRSAGKMSMIVIALRRTDGKYTSPRRQASTFIGSKPRTSVYHASARSISLLLTTTWSSPTTFTKRTLPRETEHSLSDDRALDLGGAARDRRGVRPEPLSLPEPAAGIVVCAPPQRRRGTDDGQRPLGQCLGHVGPGQLRDARLRSGFDSPGEARECPPVVQP